MGFLARLGTRRLFRVFNFSICFVNADDSSDFLPEYSTAAVRTAFARASQLCVPRWSRAPSPLCPRTSKPLLFRVRVSGLDVLREPRDLASRCTPPGASADIFMRECLALAFGEYFLFILYVGLDWEF